VTDQPPLDTAGIRVYQRYGKVLGDRVVTPADKNSRFELAPPRRFMLPALLLLLSEKPSYGYGLVPGLQEFHFGHVDRPAVYRALAQLEHDGLVEASSQNPTAGQMRRVYCVTPLGARALREWMGVIKEEHDNLGQVLRRYQATGTPDAVLAEVEGGWASALGFGWSPVSSTLVGHRRLVSVNTDDDGRAPERARDAEEAKQTDKPGQLQLFRLVPGRSVVLIEVRSTVGPLSFGAVGVTGEVQAGISDGMLRTDVSASGRLEFAVSGLRSGNRLYDAELMRRIDARRYPTVAVELQECEESGPGNRYRLKGKVTFHGVTRPAQGTVSVAAASDSRLIITGEQVFDIRDFALASPTVLMLRIYPDARVRLHAEAELEVVP
jgi:PadR family transcriptional regulator, regulatory protein PadR